MDEGEESLVLAAADRNKCRVERELDHWVSQQQAVHQFVQEDCRRLEEALRDARAL